MAGGNRNPSGQNNPGNNGHYQQVVVNELLCYAVDNIQRCNGDQIIKALDRFYNLEEIIIAKKILYDIYSDDLGDYPKRKTSGNRSEQVAHVEDIVDSIISLDASEKSVNFAAVDLNRIPRWNPNETDNFAIAEKMAMLENRLNNLEFVASENKATCIKNKDDIAKVSKILAEPDTKSYAQILKGDGQSKVANKNNVVSQMNDSRQPASLTGQVQKLESRRPDPMAGKGQSVTSRHRDPVADQKKDREGDSQRESAGNKIHSQTLEKPVEDSFQKSRYERKRENRQKRLIISGKSTGTRLKGGPPVVRKFFVYRLDKDTTDDDIMNHLNDKEIKFVSCVRLSNVDATYCSYCVSVPVDEVDKILDANTWPTGIRIRRFVQRRINDDV